MSRYRYWSVVRDASGDVVNSAVVRVYTPGPTAATIYDTEAAVSSVDYITSDTNGYFEFWVDDANYDYTTRFTILIVSADGTSVGSYSNICFVPNMKYLAHPVTIASLPVYGNNGDAIWGGLTVGQLYRTGGNPDLVCVVH